MHISRYPHLIYRSLPFGVTVPHLLHLFMILKSIQIIVIIIMIFFSFRKASFRTFSLLNCTAFFAQTCFDQYQPHRKHRSTYTLVPSSSSVVCTVCLLILHTHHAEVLYTLMFCKNPRVRSHQHIIY